MSKASIVAADTHVHLYPCYNLELAFTSAGRNLGRLISGVSGNEANVSPIKVLFLTERSDCHFFQRINELWPRTRQGGEAESVVVTTAEGDEIIVVAGRQIITAERLEVLALGCVSDFPDGRTVEDVISWVQAQPNGFPVLPWSPGKWFFRRGGVIERVIKGSGPGEVLLGDVTQRPLGWLEPLLMRKGRRKGLRVICGSDPLPFAGEETLIGSYGIVGKIDFDQERPAAELKKALLKRETEFSNFGRRGDAITVARRLLQNSAAKRKARG